MKLNKNQIQAICNHKNGYNLEGVKSNHYFCIQVISCKTCEREFEDVETGTLEGAIIEMKDSSPTIIDLTGWTLNNLKLNNNEYYY